MNRLAVLAAALATLGGTGCVVKECDRVVRVGWSSFLDQDKRTGGCSLLGVTDVEVWVDGRSQGKFSCSAGFADIPVSHGDRDFVVEGLAPDGSILVRDGFISYATCADQLVDTQPSEGAFVLDYHFTPNDVCTPGSVIWFALRDEISNDIIAADESTTPSRYACGDRIGFPLASGDYTLLRTEEAVASHGAWLITGTDCRNAAFTMAGGKQTTVSASMIDSSAACP